MTHYLRWYGNPIEAFYGDIAVVRDRAGSTPLDRKDLPWSALVEARRKRPFPTVEEEPHDWTRCREANQVIGLLNTTEDVIVFKIAMNTLISMMKREHSYVPIYPGERFSPMEVSALLALEAEA